MRRHSSIAFLSIKNESKGIEGETRGGRCFHSIRSILTFGILRRRSDTVVVFTVNFADKGSGKEIEWAGQLVHSISSCFLPRKLKSLGSGGSMFARPKLKGIDGKAPPGVEPAA